MSTDRHGRANRGDNDRHRRPSDGFRARDAARFRSLVDDAIERLPPRLAEPLTGNRITVADVPTPAVVPPAVPLAGWDGRVLTVYRRPLEFRAGSRAELEDVTRMAIGEAVARTLGLDDDLDDLLGG